MSEKDQSVSNEAEGVNNILNNMLDGDSHCEPLVMFRHGFAFHGALEGTQLLVLKLGVSTMTTL